jgi:hypothetical protein
MSFDQNKLNELMAAVIVQLTTKGKITIDGPGEFVVDSSVLIDKSNLVSRLLETAEVAVPYLAAKQSILDLQREKVTLESEITRLTSTTPLPPSPPLLDLSPAEITDWTVSIEADKKIDRKQNVYVRVALKSGNSIRMGYPVTIDNNPNQVTWIKDMTNLSIVLDFINQLNDISTDLKNLEKRKLQQTEFIKNYFSMDPSNRTKYCFHLLVLNNIIEQNGKPSKATDLPLSLSSYFEPIEYGRSGAARAASATRVEVPSVTAAADAFSGGGINSRYQIGGVVPPSIATELEQLRKEFKRVTNEYDTFIGTLTMGTISKVQATNINRLQAKQEQLRKQITNYRDIIFGKFLSSRSSSNKNYKIDQNVLMINEAVEAINSNDQYTFRDMDGNEVATVKTFYQLRKYIIDNMNDYTQLLILLSQPNLITLESAMPLAQITPSKYMLKRENGILIVEFDGVKQDMPNLFEHRKEYTEAASKSKSKCYGFVDNDVTQAQDFCVELLLKCLADNGDSLTSCKQLFKQDNWKHLVVKGIKNTNIYLIEKFLLAIGYPKTGGTFSSKIDDWFEVMKIKYSLNDQEYQQIMKNDNLQQAIILMVEKYNAIIKEEKNQRQREISTLAPMYGPHAKLVGGDLLNINLNLSGGTSILNLNKSSPSESIYKIFKEIVKESDITKSYSDFFSKMENKINSENKEINFDIKNKFRLELEAFKKSEGKLNKLSQLMHNFAWFLGVSVNDSNLSEEQKALNKKAEDLLKTGNVLNETKINSYNEIREKLTASLKKKTNTMLGLVYPFPFLFVP